MERLQIYHSIAIVAEGTVYHSGSCFYCEKQNNSQVPTFVSLNSWQTVLKSVNFVIKQYDGISMVTYS